MDAFELAVQYNGRELSFPARLLTMGYSYKIEVQVNAIQVLFEPDEERNYRAIVAESQREKIDVALLQIIATALQQALQ